MAADLILTVGEEENIYGGNGSKHSFFLSHTFQRPRRLGVFAGTLRNTGKFYFSTVRCFKWEEILPRQLIALCKNNEEWLMHVK